MKMLMFDLFTKMTLEFNYKAILPNVWKLIKLVTLHSPTTTTCERIFHLDKVVKNYLRSTMTDKRMNHLSILKHCKHMLYECDLRTCMEEFTTKNDNRMSVFGKQVII